MACGAAPALTQAWCQALRWASWMFKLSPLQLRPVS